MFGLVPSFKLALIAAAVSAALGFGGGVWVRDAFCDAAAAKKETKSLRLDQTVAQQQSQQSKASAEQIATEAAQSSEAVRDIEHDKAAMPPADVCRLSGDDVKRLRGIQ